MTRDIAFVLSLSIAIAAIIGAVRYRRINPVYHPFIYCIWLGFINEILGYYISSIHGSNAINNNLYVLAECLLITWQFKKWGLFDRTRKLYYSILAGFLYSGWLKNSGFQEFIFRLPILEWFIHLS